MATAATLFHGASNSQLPVAHPMSGNSNTATSTGSNFTANDFLTLLVTEMKNQDPTSAADPNQYVNQLVSVNSLQQLIQINETLSSAVQPASDSATGNAIPAASSAGSNAQRGEGSHASGSAPVTSVQGRPQPILGTGSHVVSGNLSVPDSNPAAQRIAQSLGHRTSRL